MEKTDLIFRCFASGSSGNCYYLGNSHQGVLIDAGISARAIRSDLKEMGLDFFNLMGVLVTHDHADHIRAVGTLGERFHVPIYATAEIHEGINKNYGVKEKLRTCCKYYKKGDPFDLGDLHINTFGISHDSTDCVGYVIDVAGQRFIMATDVGKVDRVFCQYVETANHLVIEANHDEQMLLNGPYPSYLKARILSDVGHSSNKTCGETLAKHYRKGLRNVFLCHLSHENNDRTVAYETVKGYLEGAGVRVGEDLNLVALERLTPSPIYDLTTGEIIETQTNNSLPIWNDL